ncbi:MAG: hypothetical protein Q4G34_11200 [Micrococcus sp.]|nr:hypothetical protein [Micrococcus sp.]
MEQSPRNHRLARAAGRATRAFRENQARDNQRLAQRRQEEAAADEQRLAQRAQDRERDLDARDAAEVGRVHPLMSWARRWWLGISLALFALAAVFIYRGVQAGPDGEVVDVMTGLASVGPLGGANGQYALGTVAIVLGLVAAWGTLSLYRRHPSAVSTLTTLTAVVAVPSLLRGNPFLIMLAALLVIGAVLVWLPPVRSRLRGTRHRDPRPVSPRPGASG